MDRQTEIPKQLEAFLNVHNPDETDLYMYGFIVNAIEKNGIMNGDAGFLKEKDVISTKEIREKLSEIGTGTINIHLNSGGGSAFDGITIHNLLKQHPAKIHVVIDGLAASAASVIAMAADKISMPENTVMMVHRAATNVYGNAERLEAAAEALRKIDDAVFNSYKSRFTGTDEELKQLIEKETYLTAAECYSLGFCDEVISSQQGKKLTKDEIIAKYLKDPALSTSTPNEQAGKPASTGELMYKLLKNLGGN